MKKKFGDDNITKINNHSVDLWEKYAEMGMHDEKIKKIVYLLNDNREDLINDYKKISSVILNVENSQITSRFSDFLNHRISELIKLENISINSELLIEAIARFKVELLNYLLERRDQLYLCEIKFRDGYSLFKVFKALRKSNDKIIFRILPNEIHAYVTNDSKTYLIDIILKTDNSHFIFRKQLDLLVNLDTLLKCLECNESENITTIILFKEDRLEIEQTSLILKSRISRTINDVKVDFEKENFLEELKELNEEDAESLIENEYDELVQAFYDKFQNKPFMQSLIAYGSYGKRNHIMGQSNLNFLLIIKDLSKKEEQKAGIEITEIIESLMNPLFEYLIDPVVLFNRDVVTIDKFKTRQGPG
ncbi:hypothetical protein LCGC14_1851610, partial [marine sediment metagenome]